MGLEIYKTDTILKSTLHVSYPAGEGRLVLRTELDWDRNIETVAVSDDRNTSIFELQADKPFLYFKPCLIRDGEFH